VNSSSTFSIGLIDLMVKPQLSVSGMYYSADEAQAPNKSHLLTSTLYCLQWWLINQIGPNNTHGSKASPSPWSMWGL
jgi:hypothetical protein